MDGEFRPDCGTAGQEVLRPPSVTKSDVRMASGSSPPPPSGSRHHNTWQRGGHSRRSRGGSTGSGDNNRGSAGPPWRARSPPRHGRRYRGFRGGGGRGSYYHSRYSQNWQNRTSPASPSRDSRWGPSFKPQFGMQSGPHGRPGPSPQSQGRDTPNRRDLPSQGPGGSAGRRDNRDGPPMLGGPKRRPYTPPRWNSGDRRGVPPPPTISAHIHPSRQHLHVPIPQRPGPPSGAGRGSGSFFGPHRDTRPNIHGPRAHPGLSMPLGGPISRRNRIRSPLRSPPPNHQRRPREVTSPRGAPSSGLNRSIFSGGGGEGHRPWKDGDNFPKDRGWNDTDNSAPVSSNLLSVAPVGDLRNTLSRNSAEKRRDDVRSALRRTSSSPMRSISMQDGPVQGIGRSASPNNSSRVNSSPTFSSKRHADSEVTNRNDFGSQGRKPNSARREYGARPRMRSFSPRGHMRRDARYRDFSPPVRVSNFSPCDIPLKRGSTERDGSPEREVKHESPEQPQKAGQGQRNDATPPGCDAPRWDSPTRTEGSKALREETKKSPMDVSMSSKRSPVSLNSRKEVFSPHENKSKCETETKASHEVAETSHQLPVPKVDAIVQNENPVSIKQKTTSLRADPVTHVSEPVSILTPAKEDDPLKIVKTDEHHEDALSSIHKPVELRKEAPLPIDGDVKKVSATVDPPDKNEVLLEITDANLSEKKSSTKGDPMELDKPEDVEEASERREVNTSEIEPLKGTEEKLKIEAECLKVKESEDSSDKINDPMEIVFPKEHDEVKYSTESVADTLVRPESETGVDETTKSERKEQRSMNEHTILEIVINPIISEVERMAASPKSREGIALKSSNRSLDQQESSEKKINATSSTVPDSKTNIPVKLSGTGVSEKKQVVEEIKKSEELDAHQESSETEASDPKKMVESSENSPVQHQIEKPKALPSKVIDHEPKVELEGQSKCILSPEDTVHKKAVTPVKDEMRDSVSEAVVPAKKESVEPSLKPENVTPLSEGTLHEKSTSMTADDSKTDSVKRGLLSMPKFSLPPAQISGPLPSLKLRPTPLPKLGSPKVKPLQLKTVPDESDLKTAQSEYERTSKKKTDSILSKISSVENEMNTIRNEIDLIKSQMSKKLYIDAPVEHIDAFESDAVRLSRERSERVVQEVERRIQNSFIIENPVRQFHPPHDHIMMILARNQAESRYASSKLARFCHNPEAGLESGAEPVALPIFNDDARFVRRMADAIRTVKESRRSHQKLLGREYRTLKRRWHQKQKSNRDKRPKEKREIARDRDRYLLVHTRGTSAAMTCKTSSGRTSTKVLPHVTPSGMLTNVAEIDSMLAEIEQYGGTPGSREIWQRTLAEIPEQNPNLIPFDSNSLIIDDPVAEWHAARLTNFWTREERLIFLTKYLVYQKNFTKIATFLEHKGTNDCAQFYYNNKLRYNLKQLLRESASMRRKGIREQHLLKLVGLEITEQNLALCGVDASASLANANASVSDLTAQGSGGALMRSIAQKKKLDRERKSQQSLHLTAEERQLFCEALLAHGTNWKSILDHYPNLARSPSLLQDYFDRTKNEHDFMHYVRKYERRANTVKLEAQNILERVRSPRIEKLSGESIAMSPRVSRGLVGSPVYGSEDKKAVWSQEERRKVEGMFREFGRDYKLIAQKMGTKTPAQVKGYWKFLRASREGKVKKHRREKGERKSGSDGARESRKRDAHEAELGDSGSGSASKREKSSHEGRDLHPSSSKAVVSRKENSARRNEDT